MFNEYLKSQGDCYSFISSIHILEYLLTDSLTVHKLTYLVTYIFIIPIHIYVLKLG